MSGSVLVKQILELTTQQADDLGHLYDGVEGLQEVTLFLFGEGRKIVTNNSENIARQKT